MYVVKNKGHSVLVGHHLLDFFCLGDTYVIQSPANSAWVEYASINPILDKSRSLLRTITAARGTLGYHSECWQW
jgi:hypothetical protein